MPVKRLWLAMALLAVLTAGALLSARYVQSTADRLDMLLEQSCGAALAGNWSLAEHSAGAARQLWQDRSFPLHVILRHGDTDLILLGFQDAERQLLRRDADQFSASGEDLRLRIALLAEMERPSLDNIL